MATASTLTWKLSRDNIIEGALRKCGVLAKGQTPSSEDYEDCTEALNALIHFFATKGMPLWKRTTVQITPVSGTKDYVVNHVWKIVQVVLSDNTSGTQIELLPKSLYDLNRLPDTTSGQPVNFTVLAGLDTATLRVWPTPDASVAANKKLEVVYQKEFGAFSLSTDTPDFPAYWTEALVYGLAVRIAPEYGVPLQDRQDLQQQYRQALAAAEGYGDEDGSMYWMPDRRC
jgi:hypothetical protein